MKIDIRDLANSNIVHIMSDEVDDYKALASVIKPGDIITTQIRRKLKDKGKIEIYISSVEVREIEFEVGSNEMRLRGVHTENTEFASQDSPQRILLRLGTKFDLYKNNWTDEEIQTLKNSQDNGTDVETAIFVLNTHSVSLFNQLGKLISTEQLNNNTTYASAVHSLLSNLEKDQLKCIVILSHCTNTNQITQYLTINSIALNITEIVKQHAIIEGRCQSGTSEDVLNALKLLSDRIYSHVYSFYINEFDKFKNLMQKDIDGISLGLDNIKRAIYYGAVDTLYVSESFIEEMDNKRRAAFTKCMNNLMENGSNVIVFPSKLRETQDLNNLNGIAASLRFHC